MGKKLEIEVGSMYNNWKVLETNIINPNTTNKIYINRPVFSKCLCMSCEKTIRLVQNNLLSRLSNQCNRCSLVERNTKNNEVQTGLVYGKLKVIGDAGFKIVSGGKRRHFSICECECKNIVEVMDNQLQTHNKVSCGCLSSKGEYLISTILDKNNVVYNRDCVFQELLEKTGRRLRFDFIIYNKDGSVNRFIEFDGSQHKTGMNGGIWSNSETYEVIHERDMIKNNFCLENNYKLIRLPYHTIKNMTIDKIMGDAYLVSERSDDCDKTK